MDRIYRGYKLIRINRDHHRRGRRHIRRYALNLLHKKSDDKGALSKGDEVIEPGDISSFFLSNSTDQFSQITRSVGKSDPDLGRRRR